MNDVRRIRVGLMSDIHNEFEPPRRPTAKWLELDRERRKIDGHPAVGPLLDGLRAGNADLVVLAGDIDLGVKAIEYANLVSEFLGVRTLTIMGNHEAYHGRDLTQLIPEMRVAAKATAGRVTFLENEAVTLDIKGQRLHVLGCSLWTDYRINGSDARQVEWAKQSAREALNDHQCIVKDGAVFKPEDAEAMHVESRKWLAREIERIRSEEDDLNARILVVTHHAPIPEANGEFIGGKLCPAFASDMTAEILDWCPTAWFFGHTHISLDKIVGNTRVVSAQRGYVCQEPGAEDFLPKILEV
jgi:hypothetical protein